MRFGTLIKSVFALFANFELEKTDGKVLGREGDDDARLRSVLLGGGPGVAYLSTGGLNSDIKKELVIQTGIPYLEFRSRLICFNCASLSPSVFSFP